MARIINGSPLHPAISLEGLKEIKNFIRDYSSKGLTIHFTRNWKKRVRVNRGKRKYAWRSLTNLLGYFQSCGSDLGVGDITNIRYPAIVVKVSFASDDWKKVFYHEWGHYLQSKTVIYNHGKTRYSERNAEEFAALKSREPSLGEKINKFLL